MADVRALSGGSVSGCTAFPVKFQGMLFLPFAMFGIHLLGSNIKFRMPSF
jgi:hypothetical protein